MMTMTGSTSETVLSLIVETISNNAEKVYYISQTCGGWEIWLQCELAYALGPVVQREVDVWGDGRACDLFFGKENFIVELKCLGWNVIQNSRTNGGHTFRATNSAIQRFVERVAEDQQKVTDFPGGGVSVAIIPEFKGSDSELLAHHFAERLYGKVPLAGAEGAGVSMYFWRKP